MLQLFRELGVSKINSRQLKHTKSRVLVIFQADCMPSIFEKNSFFKTLVYGTLLNFFQIARIVQLIF